MSEDTGLDAWFVHEKLVLNLLSRQDGVELGRRIPGPAHPFAQTMRLDAFERVVAAYLARNDVASLAAVHHQGTLAEGKVLWLEQPISFKGFGPAWAAIDSGADRDARASFSAVLSTDSQLRVRGTFNPRHMTCNSAFSQLSGTKSQFVLGYVQRVTDDEVELRPIVIAQRWLRPRPELDIGDPGDPAHIAPRAVDQFAGVNFAQRLTKKDLEVLRTVSETRVKTAFAELLGEPEVPKDWGGEQFDLWTFNRLTVEGRPLRTAIAFKGPAKFHPMRIADLGKNGDQIDRLAQTAADLIVVQHCNAITAPVVNMLRVYAESPRRPRRYMTIDGYDTFRILRHIGIV
ncbi:hypothetical protein [Paractinoplanes globisporus]|uniref:Restriction endonuclease n=1 Tax=Paractinoplanes globisporus TaxID=113565 RepID=A0ABW6WF53_9ACTN|nr:hypothetical protein [Actinoplanes globisporus]